MNLDQEDIDFFVAQLMMNGMGEGALNTDAYAKTNLWLMDYETAGYLYHYMSAIIGTRVKLTDKAIAAIKEWNDVHG